MALIRPKSPKREVPHLPGLTQHQYSCKAHSLAKGSLWEMWPQGECRDAFWSTAAELWSLMLCTRGDLRGVFSFLLYCYSPTQPILVVYVNIHAYAYVLAQDNIYYHGMVYIYVYMHIYAHIYTQDVGIYVHRHMYANTQEYICKSYMIFICFIYICIPKL